MSEQSPEASQGSERRRIPDFKSREEEAEFWDTHDVTDYFGELRPVRVTPMPGLSAGMTVRLDAEDRERLGRLAAARGIGPSTLVRMWIKERLRDEG